MINALNMAVSCGLDPKEEGVRKVVRESQTKKSETNPKTEEDDFKKGKHGKGEGRGVDHEADEGVGKDEHDDPKQAGQPGEQPH